LVSAITGSDAVATTDASGRYRLDGAPAGPLTLLAKKEGYRTKLVSGVVVDAGRTVTRDITLAAVDGGPGLELAGIGANIQSRDGHIVLANLFQGDPAERSGLHVGDRIVRIDGESTAGMSVNDAIQRIRGEPGTAVGLSIERDGVPQELVVTRATVVH
jgi:C-terminal processing protease CtpA/Prc